MSTLTVSTITNLVAQVAFFARQTPPAGWLEADGTAVSRMTYADLFAEIGTTYGVGDGSTTFNLPDMRGEFARGWDHGKGVDTGRAFGSAQLDQMQKLTGSFTASMLTQGNITPVVAGALTDEGNGAQTGLSSSNGSFNNSRIIGFDSAESPDARVSSDTEGETRARNIALLACIKY